MKRLVVCGKCGYVVLRPVTEYAPVDSHEADNEALSGHFGRTPWGCVDARPYVAESIETTFLSPTKAAR